MPSALVVEDEAVTALELVRLLESWGYDAVSVSTGEEAIETALKMKPDIILMDIVLQSEVDGVRAASAIKRVIDVPVVFLTAYSSRKIFKRASEVEPDAYLLKPFNSRELAYALELALYKNKMQKLLSHANRRYQQILDTTGEGVCIFSSDGIIQYCNRRMADFLSCRRGDITGKSIFDFVHPGDRKTMERIFDSCRKGASGEREIRFRAADGTTKWMILSGHPITELSQFKGGFCMFRDVTEQKMVERRLRKTNRCLELLSRINLKAAVSTDPSELMKGICKLLVDEGYSHASFRTPDGVTEGEGPIPDVNLREGIHKGKGGSTAVIQLENCKKPFYLVVSAMRKIDEAEMKFLREIASSTAETLRRITSESELDSISSRYREIFENAGDAIFLTKDKKIIECNRTALELFRASEDEIKGKTPWELSPEYQKDGKSSELAQAIIERAMSGERCEFDWLHRKITGEVFPTRVTVSRSGDLVMGIVRDMTDLHRAHKKLRTEHRKFRDILESIPDPTFAIDTDGRVIAWNREMEKLTGVRKEEIMGEGDRAYAIPFYGKRTPGLLEFILKPEDAPERYKNIRMDGNSIYAEVYVGHMGRHFQIRTSPIYDEHEEVIGAVEILRDVTDYIETKKKLEKSRESYRTIFENRATPTAVTDTDFNILRANRVFKEIFGRSEGINMADIIHEGDLEKLHGLQDKCRALIRMKADDRILHMIVHRGDIPGSGQVVLSFNDITKLKMSQHKLRDELRIRMALSEIYPHAVSAESIEEFTEYILDAACQVTGAEKGAIRLKNRREILVSGSLSNEEIEAISEDGISSAGDSLRFSSSSGDMKSEIILTGGDFHKSDLRAVKHLSQYYLLAVRQLAYRKRMMEHQNHLRLINIILKSAETDDPGIFMERVLDAIIRCPEFRSAAAYIEPDLRLERGMDAPEELPDFPEIKLHENFAEIPIIVDDEVKGTLKLGLEADEIPEKTEFLEILGAEISDGIQRIMMHRQIVESLYEKEVLLREIHHRVKNNLQIVASLLSLQSAYTDNPEILNILRDSQLRVRTMAVAHEKIYQSKAISTINLGEYLKTLADEMVTLQSNDRRFIELKFEYDDIMVEMERCIPLGLITNEIISNSVKHAFTGDRGKISVSIRKTGDNCVLEISDNGRGLPADFNIEELTSLGMQLVANLVRQIDGELEYGNHDGACFRITFPIIDSGS
ncbi:PAS domain S-box protein [Methanothermobacter sp. KEPCO-1]|uniref:Predicted sensory transduction histidine kinase n=1 Tax=Methanothermobacter marburgensis (strain ATCC BAA-927 / DSM 2133 / JCM 14651 / NBRC 100331 / OCM 82 / Marburg) TaxID=79929 RepID=D9PW47_METTM|nr:MULTISPECIES: PAS domain S-box protein [Methanothermobacter]ADL58445.1 predicted sensory transduction histidine kinase [Methanothermobacter marburgensis str. Marburg]QEF93704.1 PAS domain S-box protein [Methanothermobacter sp. KEPCO-1]WBF10579.1 PAS domain S-box protein [Methanothermobacter marburgensis]